jgi:hypothetical protein
MRRQAQEWHALAAEAAAHRARADALEEEAARQEGEAEALRARVAELEEALEAAQGRAAVLEEDLDRARREMRAVYAQREEDRRLLARLRSALGDAGHEERGRDAGAVDAEAAAGDPADADGRPQPVAKPPGRGVRMGEWLLAKGRLAGEALEWALGEQRHSHERLGRILVRMGHVTDVDVAECLAEQFAIPFERLNGNLETDPGALEALPVHAARAHCCFPLKCSGRVLTVAMANPQDLVALDEIRRMSGREIKPAAAPQEAVLRAIEKYYAA